MTRGAALAVRLAAVCVVFGAAGCAAPPAGDARDAREPRESRADADAGAAEKRARVRLELASAYFSRGQLPTALDEIKLALAAKPDLADAFNLRGLVYAAQGEAALAEQSFQRALALNPRDGGTLHNHAWFLCQLRRFDDAEAQFAQVLALPGYTDQARSLMARGVCQARAGRWADAERQLARSFELDPSNPSTSFAYAEVLYRRGEYERARFYVRRINSQPDQSNAQTLWLATRIERRLGNVGAVEDFARQLRDRYPNSPEVAALMRGQFDD